MLEKIKESILTLSDREFLQLKNFINKLDQEKNKKMLEKREEILKELSNIKTESGEPYFHPDYIKEKIFKIK